MDGSIPEVETREADLGNVQAAQVVGQNVESPLDPKTTVRLCTFSPCIEQVQRTVSTLRQLGWVDVEMVEMAARRIEVRRDRVGLHEEGVRGVTVAPASVEEAVMRLKEVEGRTKVFHGETTQHVGSVESGPSASLLEGSLPQSTKQERIGNIKEGPADRKLYKQGRLVHRTEQELKTHTSYLVFALLPREWTAEDEEKCQQTWPAEAPVPPTAAEDLSKRQMKKAAKLKAGGNKAYEEMQEQITATASVESLQHDGIHRDSEPAIDANASTS